MSIYETNLSALSKVDEALANGLKNITTNEIFEVFLAENDLIDNVNIIDNRDTTSIHIDNTDIDKKLEEYVEFDNYHSLYFFGIGSGVFYQKLLQNVNHKKIYIFEPELELIYIVLNLIDFSKDIEDRRINIKLSSSINLASITGTVAGFSSLYLKKYNLDIYSHFYDKYLDEIKRVNDIVLLFFKHVLQNKGDSIQDTITGLKHSSNKMFSMIEAPSLLKVINSVKNRKDAVMVATGPSLKKQLPLLKKYQEYFTILCIDASFPILIKNGIKPDIVLSMERVDLTAQFYKETPKEFHKDVVFLFSTVCHEETFNAIDSSGVVIPYLRGDKHNLVLGLQDYGYLGGGLSSANYMMNFAINARFENLVLIGQDLAYGKDGSSHSSGHVFGEDEIKDDKFDGYIKAYGGDGEVATQKYWKIFLNDLVLQIAASKRYIDMNIYNATEGGACIDGAIEIPFLKYCEDILDKSKVKEPIKLKYPSQSEVKDLSFNYVKKQRELLKVANSVKKHAKKAFELTEKFLTTIKNYSDDDISNKLKDKDIDELLNKIYDVRGKYANEFFLNAFSTLLESYLSHLDFEIAAVKTMRENTPTAIKLKKVNYVKVNYEWLYRLFTSLTEMTKIIDDSLKKEKLLK
ncbi:MAG: 6-hydroxymethylpterin diphosphokinase MptE-like protein [Campylobacterota bacterium]|nr:6-hydroxymethylpterin diphosphokinase MptE-like protein [Campylobacterota bacterium]